MDNQKDLNNEELIHWLKLEVRQGNLVTSRFDLRYRDNTVWPLVHEYRQSGPRQPRAG